MVLGMYSHKGNVMHSQNFGKVMTIDTKKCLKALKEVVKPGHHYMFQQDGTPHTA